MYIYTYILNLKWVPQNSVPIADVFRWLHSRPWCVNSVYIHIADCCLDQLRSEQKSILVCRNATPEVPPFLSKRNPWGTTRSHCWTTTLPWPTTSAKWSSHQALWPNILGKCFVTRLFRKWTFEFNQQFLYLLFWEGNLPFLWPTALWTFLWLMGNSSSKTQTAGLPSLLHSFASPADQVVTWESTSCTQHKQKHWLKNQICSQKFIKRGPFALLQQCQCLRLWIAQRSTIGWWKAPLKR